MNDELVERLRQLELRITAGANEACGQAADRIEALTAQLTEARESERVAMTAVDGLKDALAQTAEFICRKCGQRQDGPTDNEARF